MTKGLLKPGILRRHLHRQVHLLQLRQQAKALPPLRHQLRVLRARLYGGRRSGLPATITMSNGYVWRESNFLFWFDFSFFCLMWSRWTICQPLIAITFRVERQHWFNQLMWSKLTPPKLSSQRMAYTVRTLLLLFVWRSVLKICPTLWDSIKIQSLRKKIDNFSVLLVD